MPEQRKENGKSIEQMSEQDAAKAQFQPENVSATVSPYALDPDAQSPLSTSDSEE